MKCDHIRTRMQGGTPFFPNMLNNGKVEVCLKEDVDAAIDELKTEHHKERHEYIEMVAQLRRENEELKARLETVQATAYADSVDAGMRERRLRRALYKALANWAHFAVAFFSSFKTKDKWHKMEHKCLKKAEEYK